MKLSEIAEKLSCKLEGDPNAEIRDVAGIEDAGPGDLHSSQISNIAPRLKPRAPPRS